MMGEISGIKLSDCIFPGFIVLFLNCDKYKNIIAINASRIFTTMMNHLTKYMNQLKEKGHENLSHQCTSIFRNQETSYLKEATYRHTGVTVALCANVGSRQTVAFPIYLLAKA